ncbi:MAG: PEP-CTERM sorting domain-containing protein [Gammaproteobacteria bacterium]|nr:PEP-CTERM sorting domain-containing protein [Gammaproteobacteria bacterium]
MKIITTLFVLMLSPAIALATPIVATPFDDGGPLRVNNFHSADEAGGTAGDILAWFDLDTSATNFWNEVSGDLSMTVDLFDDETFANGVGSATASSSNLIAANINENGSRTAGLIGNILWTFDATAIAFFNTLGLDVSSGITMSFMDIGYSQTTSDGDVANSYVDNLATLWGSDGDFNPSTGAMDGATLGVDMQMEMPEPGVLALLMLGVAGLGATRKRGKN